MFCWVPLLSLLSVGVVVDADSSYASSYSYSGGAPVTYTSTSGLGTAYASAGPYNPLHTYYNNYYNRFPGFPFLPFIFPPYYRYRRSINRSDSAQQIQQVKIPPGLEAYGNKQEVAAQMPPVEQPQQSSEAIKTVEKLEDIDPEAKDGISRETLVLNSQDAHEKPILLPSSSELVVDNI